MRRGRRQLLALAAGFGALVALLLLWFVPFCVDVQQIPKPGEPEHFQEALGVAIQPRKIYSCSHFPGLGFDGASLTLYKLPQDDVQAIQRNLDELAQRPRHTDPAEQRFSHWKKFAPESAPASMMEDFPDIRTSCPDPEYAPGFTPEMVDEILDHCLEGDGVYLASHGRFTDDTGRRRSLPSYSLYLLNLDRGVFLSAGRVH
jgi:hypothetical protein